MVEAGSLLKGKGRGTPSAAGWIWRAHSSHCFPRTSGARRDSWVGWEGVSLDSSTRRESEK